MNYETTLEAQDGARYPLEGADAELSAVPGEDVSNKRRKWAIIAIVAAIALVAAWYAERPMGRSYEVLPVASARSHQNLDAAQLREI